MFTSCPVLSDLNFKVKSQADAINRCILETTSFFFLKQQKHFYAQINLRGSASPSCPTSSRHIFQDFRETSRFPAAAAAAFHSVFAPQWSTFTSEPRDTVGRPGAAHRSRIHSHTCNKTKDKVVCFCFFYIYICALPKVQFSLFKADGHPVTGAKTASSR